MPGESKKTVVRSVRVKALGAAALDAVAEKYGESVTDAHKRALIAGCRELLGAVAWSRLVRAHPPAVDRKDVEIKEG